MSCETFLMPSNFPFAHVSGQSWWAIIVTFSGTPEPEKPVTSRQPWPFCVTTPAKYWPNWPSAGPMRVTFGSSDVIRHGVE